MELILDFDLQHCKGVSSRFLKSLYLSVRLLKGMKRKLTCTPLPSASLLPELGVL
ncbi:mCG1026948, isoform CRA_b [Mus musculus]|nr:mCG1026948, isoform CRA_b [Mus musculus]